MEDNPADVHILRVALDHQGEEYSIELIRDGETGLLFTAGSLPSLLEKLELVLSGSVNAAALGSTARDDVIANRQWRHMATVYESAYKRAQAHQAA